MWSVVYPGDSQASRRRKNHLRAHHEEDRGSRQAGVEPGSIPWLPYIGFWIQSDVQGEETSETQLNENKSEVDEYE
jgi:hypothetical protein